MSGIYVPAKGNPSARLAIIGQFPSYEDENALEPFSSSVGRELDRICKAAGINRLECWLSNVCKFQVPFTGDKKKSFVTRCQEAGIDIEKQIDELRIEIQTIEPNCILALGKVALWALTGKQEIDDYRGSILTTWMGIKVIATYNPGQFLYQDESTIKEYWKRQVTIFDFKRAQEESLTKDLQLPSHTLYIARNSSDVYQFINDHEKYESFAEDIEADKCIPTCIGLAFNRYVGMTVDLWNGLNDTDLANSWILIAKLNMNKKKKVIGQNFKYDGDKIRRIGLPIWKLWSDTMFKAFVCNPELPKTLAFNTSLYTRQPFYKNEGMYEGSRKDLLLGCALDSCCTIEVDEEQQKDIDEMQLEKFYRNFMMPLHPLYMDIENEGFCVNTEIRDELLRKYIHWDEKLRYELFKYTGKYINVNSWQQVGKLLYDELKIPYRKGTGEEVLTSLLNNVVKDELRRNVIENILEDRRVKKVIGNNLSAFRDYDGKMRTTYFLCLDTGRSSTGQQEPPIRPTEDVVEIGEDGKRKKKKKVLGSAFQVMTKHGDIGPEVRRMYEPEPGYIFLQADSSQAEARVIFLLAEDYQALEDIDKHDYHALTASWFFGGKEEDYSKKILGYESPVRFAGKTLRHAGHLGAGKRRAAVETNTQARKYKINLTITEKDADNALKIFHQKQPKIRGVFQEGVKIALEKDRKRLRAPVPYGIDAEIGGTRIFYERWGDELFRQAFSYIPQRTVSENTKAAAIRIRYGNSWIKIIVESHDALLVSVPIERKQEAANILKTEFERAIDFASCSLSRGKLVIPCEVEEGMNYYDMSKFRFEPLPVPSWDKATIDLSNLKDNIRNLLDNA